MIVFPAMDVILKEAGLLNDDQLNRCMVISQETREPIEEVALKQKYFTDAQMRELLQAHFNVPFVDLAQVRPDAAMLKLIPERVMRDNHAIAVRRHEDGLAVAMVDPL